MGNKLKREEHLERIKDAINNSELSEDEKSNSFKHIEEWYQEDRALGSLYEKLAEVSPKIEALLSEMGLI